MLFVHTAASFAFASAALRHSGRMGEPSGDGGDLGAAEALRAHACQHQPVILVIEDQCDDTEFVPLGGLVVGPKPFGTKGLSTVIKPVSFRLFMPVVVHRTVVPCERMALVPSPHSW